MLKTMRKGKILLDWHESGNRMPPEITNQQQSKPLLEKISFIDGEVKESTLGFAEALPKTMVAYYHHQNLSFGIYIVRRYNPLIRAKGAMVQW